MSLALAAAAVLAAVLSAPAPAGGTRSTAVIAVVAPSAANPAVTEALSRFRGEAASVGFEVTVVLAGATGGSPVAQMESAAHAASAIATVAFVGGADARALDVWFTDRSTGKTVRGHVSVENEAGDRASAVLAVKAVDFLRARMFDFLVARPAAPSSDPPSRPPAPPADGAAAPPAPGLDAPRPLQPMAARSPSPAVTSFAARRLALSIGVGALRSLEGLGTMVLPLVRVSHALTPGSSLGISIAGLGTRARVDAMGGGASVTEDLAMGELTATLGGARVRPTLRLGAGVHEVRAAGVASAPFTMRVERRLYFAAALSAGLQVILDRWLAVQLEAGSFLLFPEPQVIIAGLDAGRTGRPGLSAALALESRF